MQSALSDPLAQDPGLLPKYRSVRVYRALRAGQLLCGTLASCAWYGAWFFGQNTPGGFSTQGILSFCLFVSGLLVALAIVILHRLAASANAQSAAEVLQRDGRHPIIFLRPFTKDQLFHIESLESVLCEIFGKFGPVVAIGRPGETFGVPGAARLYASNDRWQSSVLQLLSEAQTILLVAGKTTGVDWELRSVLNCADPRKVLLIADGLDAYNSLRTTANQQLGNPMPALSLDETTKVKRCGWSKFFTAFVFDSSWNSYRLANVHDKEDVSDRDGNLYQHDVFSLFQTLAPFINRENQDGSRLAGVPPVIDPGGGAFADSEILAEANYEYQRVVQIIKRLLTDTAAPTISEYGVFVWNNQKVLLAFSSILVWTSIIGLLPLAMAVFPAGGKEPTWSGVAIFFIAFLLMFPCGMLDSHFGKTVEKAAKSLAGEILKFSSCLSVQPIPFYLLKSGAEHIGPLSHRLLKDAESSVIQNTLRCLTAELALSNYSLISLDLANESYSLNPIASDAIRRSMSASDQTEWIQRSIFTLHEICHSTLGGSTSSQTLLLPHIATVLGLADEFQISTAEVQRLKDTKW